MQILWVGGKCWTFRREGHINKYRIYLVLSALLCQQRPHFSTQRKLKGKCSTVLPRLNIHNPVLRFVFRKFNHTDIIKTTRPPEGDVFWVHPNGSPHETLALGTNQNQYSKLHAWPLNKKRNVILSLSLFFMVQSCQWQSDLAPNVTFLSRTTCFEFIFCRDIFGGVQEFRHWQPPFSMS